MSPLDSQLRLSNHRRLLIDIYVHWAKQQPYLSKEKSKVFINAVDEGLRHINNLLIDIP
mgnify:FL=1